MTAHVSCFTWLHKDIGWLALLALYIYRGFISGYNYDSFQAGQAITGHEP